MPAMVSIHIRFHLSNGTFFSSILWSYFLGGGCIGQGRRKEEKEEEGGKGGRREGKRREGREGGKKGRRGGESGSRGKRAMMKRRKWEGREWGRMS